MTQTYFLALALSAMRWYVGSGVFDRLTSMIVFLIEANWSGKEKRDRVISFAREELHIIKDELLVSEFIVKAIIELTLAKNSPKPTTGSPA